MSETNPYKPPVSIEDAAAHPAPDFQPAARAVDAGRAWEWLVSGFGLFKKQPGMLGMQFGRRRDVNRIDARIGDQPPGIVVERGHTVAAREVFG